MENTRATLSPSLNEYKFNIDRLNVIKKWVATQVAEQKVAGMSVAISHEGVPVFDSSAGLQSLETQVKKFKFSSIQFIKRICLLAFYKR